jgi:hypothetical protein
LALEDVSANVCGLEGNRPVATLTKNPEQLCLQTRFEKWHQSLRQITALGDYA